MRITKFVLLLTVLFGAACAQKSQDHNLVDAPNIDLACDATTATACVTTNTNKDIYIGLHHDLSVDCKQYLSLYTGDSFTFEFSYSAFSQTKKSGLNLIAQTTHWVNQYAAPVNLLATGRYKVCAYIDINSNGEPDGGEPYYEDEIRILSQNLSLSNWSNY